MSAQRTHQRGLKFYVATFVQIEGRTADNFASPTKQAVRREVNQWIRSSQDIDGYIDFDRAMADPANPNRMSATFHDADFHPNGAGQRALSEAVDLAMFE